MAKVQFNCRLDSDVFEWITKEAERQSAESGAKVSQADVITVLVNRASVGLDGARRQRPQKLSKKAAHIKALRASDPMAADRDDIEHGNMELPSGGSVSVVGAANRNPELYVSAGGQVLRSTLRQDGSTTHEIAHLDAVSENRGKASLETWRAGRKPLLKPGGAKR